MADQSDFLSENEKALLDTEELSGVEDDAPVAPDSDKVELDLEDAPFLEDEEEEEEEAAASGEETYDALDKTPRKFDIKALIKDRRFQIGGGSGLLILLLALFFLWPDPEPPPEIEIDLPESLPTAQQNATNATPPVEKKDEVIVAFEPFWVEHEEDDGTVRFLYCKFAAPAPSEKVAWEIRHKKVVLRDAIFYYLRNKDLTFLADKSNAEQLKNDLLSVVNQYLGNAQLETILIEEYLVK